MKGARSAARRTLDRWSPRAAHAEDLFREETSRLASDADRAFARELVYGVIRNLSLLDFVIRPRAAGTLDRPTKNALRLGVYQILFTRVPTHAAVHETVAIAGRAKPLANAVLRRVARERDAVEAEIAAAPDWTRLSHPDFLFSRWKKAFGKPDAIALCEWDNRPADLFVRANGLKTTPELLAPLLDQPEPVPGRPGMFHVRSLPGEALDHGLCYAQDPVTLLACDLLGARPGERILDACAAPGGKAAVLAEAMGGEGELVACDSVPARIEVLRANLARLGVPCATVVRHDWAAGGETVPEGTFDRILLDAPCTNSGVLRRRIDARWRLEPSDFTRMAALQETILRALVPLLRPGGVLVYSTCSVDPEENGAVAGKIAGAIPGLELVTEETRLPFRDGTDGAYAARFERAGQ